MLQWVIMNSAKNCFGKLTACITTDIRDIIIWKMECAKRAVAIHSIYPQNGVDEKRRAGLFEYAVNAESISYSDQNVEKHST